MTTDAHDPRDIPVLTEAVDADGRVYGFVDAKAVHATVVTETLKLADSLLHQAAKNMEATLFERVFDQLRERLPELVDQALRTHAMPGTDLEIGVSVPEPASDPALPPPAADV